MKLTVGVYYLDTGNLYITKYNVIEKPNTYKSTDVVYGNVFKKENEEKVRNILGYKSSYLEVYTLDETNPIQKIQNLIQEDLMKRCELVKEKTFVDGSLYKEEIQNNKESDMELD